MAKRKAARGVKKAKPGKAARVKRAASRKTARKAASASRSRKAPKAKKRRTPARTSARTSSKSRPASTRVAASRKRLAAPKARSKAKKVVRARPPEAKRRIESPADQVRVSRLNRERRTLDETVQTPPSSLDMDRRGTAARTGRAEIEQHRENHATMSPAITGGDVDADVEAAYFSGDGSPGGDNQTPDQDIVDDIGKALGVEYNDNEELRASDKVTDRDKHRWELDPASAEDYKDRK
jgi:hypothetical protein